MYLQDQSGDDMHNTYQCSACRFITRNIDQLTEHFRTHITEPDIYECTNYDFVIETIETNETSTENFSEKTTAEVETCTDSIATFESQPLEHSDHLTSSQRTFVCPECTYQTDSETIFKGHTLTHQLKNKAYKCPRCDFSCQYSTSLVMHLCTHIDCNPNKCPYCEYTARSKGHLMTHIRIHTGEKPFQCHLCSYASAVKHNLEKHVQRMHLQMKERPQVVVSPSTSATNKPNPSFLSCSNPPTHPKNTKPKETPVNNDNGVFHDIVKYSCGQCSSYFLSAAGLEHHQMTHGDG